MSKAERYETLDGLRGLAAVSVVIYHLSIIGSSVVLPHGWLAVDFFFVLSGFVMAHSYTEKLSTLSLTSFVRRRLRRILPLSVLGALVGTFYFLVRWRVHPGSLYSLADIVSGSAFNVLLLPKPWISPAPTDTTFAANTPLWSLSFEMMINVIWAAFLVRSRTAVLVTVCLFSVVGLGVFALYFQTANLGATWPTFLGGAFRTAFGFHVGVLLWRYRPRTSSSKAVPWVAMALLLGLLAIPEHGPGLDLVLIVLALPALMWLATCADNQAARPVFRYLGELSYPLYVIHVPVLMVLAGALKSLHIAHASRAVELGAVVFSLVLSMALGKLYDEPVRALLARNTRRKPLAPQHS